MIGNGTKYVRHLISNGPLHRPDFIFLHSFYSSLLGCIGWCEGNFYPWCDRVSAPASVNLAPVSIVYSLTITAHSGGINPFQYIGVSHVVSSSAVFLSTENDSYPTGSCLMARSNGRIVFCIASGLIINSVVRRVYGTCTTYSGQPS